MYRRIGEPVAGEHLLLADTPAAFAQATLALLGDAGLRARVAVAARRLAEERYDWEQIGRQFVGLVEGTVHRRGALLPV